MEVFIHSAGESSVNLELAQHLSPFQNFLCTKSSYSPRSLAKKFQQELCFLLQLRFKVTFILGEVGRTGSLD